VDGTAPSGSHPEVRAKIDHFQPATEDEEDQSEVASGRSGFVGDNLQEIAGEAVQQVIEGKEAPYAGSVGDPSLVNQVPSAQDHEHHEEQHLAAGGA